MWRRTGQCPSRSPCFLSAGSFYSWIFPLYLPKTSDDKVGNVPNNSLSVFSTLLLPRISKKGSHHYPFGMVLRVCTKRSGTFHRVCWHTFGISCTFTSSCLYLSKLKFKTQQKILNTIRVSSAYCVLGCSDFHFSFYNSKDVPSSLSVWGGLVLKKDNNKNL
jgi:hypothetical protein